MVGRPPFQVQHPLLGSQSKLDEVVSQPASLAAIAIAGGLWATPHPFIGQLGHLTTRVQNLLPAMVHLGPKTQSPSTDWKVRIQKAIRSSRMLLAFSTGTCGFGPNIFQGQWPFLLADGHFIKADGRFIKANGHFIKPMAVLSRGATLEPG